MSVAAAAAVVLDATVDYPVRWNRPSSEEEEIRGELYCVLQQKLKREFDQAFSFLNILCCAVVGFFKKN
jgi:hypothetical protein